MLSNVDLSDLNQSLPPWNGTRMNLFCRYLDDANVAEENVSFVIFDVNLISIFIHINKFYIITTNNCNIFWYNTYYQWFENKNTNKWHIGLKWYIRLFVKPFKDDYSSGNYFVHNWLMDATNSFHYYISINTKYLNWLLRSFCARF